MTDQLTQEERRSPNRIGNLNGKWALGFKYLISIAGVAVPVGLAILGWVLIKVTDMATEQAVLATKVQSFVSAGPRYTPDMAKADNLALRIEILGEVAKMYPPEWLTRELESHNRRLTSMEEINP